MSTSTLQNFRVGSDLTVKVRLKDGGVAIDWSTLSGIRAVLYSDAQSSIAGRCDVTVDGEDPTLLVCRYAATKMQYLGVNRIVVSAKYMGVTKTYDKPAFTFVRWSEDQAGEEITIEDPEVTVEIDVEDVSSSILQEAVDAAFSAADRANEAAEAAEHMVDIHTGPKGDKGDTGETPDISIGTVTTVEPGTPAAASMGGTPEAPVLNLSIPKGLVGATPNFTVGTVTTGEPGSSVIVTITGTPEAPVLNVTIPQGMQGNTGSSVDYPYELVNNLTTNDATKGLSAAQGVVLDGKVSQLEAKVTDLSAEEALDLDEEIKVTTEDGQTTILEITEDGVDAKDLKSNGVPVLTSHQDISGLATKTELEDGLAEKQDKIEEISIDGTHTSESEEQIWSSDNYDESTNAGELYAKINHDGLFVKDIHKLDGSPLANDFLYGKKWAVLGDSFTDGATSNTIPDGKYAGKRKVYPYFIGNRTGLNVLNTFFASGRTLAFPENPGTFTNSICNPNAAFYYQNIPVDVDYITIYLGINDSHHAPGSGGGDGEDNTGEIPIGTIEDNTTSTYYGAWNVVLSWLIENRPFAHIGIIVTNGCGNDNYRLAQIAIARKYGIPFIDLNGDDRTPFMLRTTNPNIPATMKTIRIQKQAVDYDGTQTGSVNWHPNDDAHLFESYFIESFLRTL